MLDSKPLLVTTAGIPILSVIADLKETASRIFSLPMPYAKMAILFGKCDGNV
jgi:hypothetical protein